MKTSLDDIFENSYPKLDLHGEIRDSARVLIKEFIHDNYIMRNEKIVIVHGNGMGIIKDEVNKVLKNNKYVISFHTNHYNSGSTLVYIRKRG